MAPTTQLKQSQQQAEQAFDQLAQAHGIVGGSWGQILLPVLIQLIQDIQSKTGVCTPQGELPKAP